MTHINYDRVKIVALKLLRLFAGLPLTFVGVLGVIAILVVRFNEQATWLLDNWGAYGFVTIGVVGGALFVAVHYLNEWGNGRWSKTIVMKDGLILRVPAGKKPQIEVDGRYVTAFRGSDQRLYVAILDAPVGEGKVLDAAVWPPITRDHVVPTGTADQLPPLAR